MTGRVLVCRDCGQPLEIVCPSHGATVSRVVSELHAAHAASLASPTETKPLSAASARRRRVCRPGVTADVMGALSHDPEHPSGVNAIATAIDRTVQAVQCELTNLVKAGRVERVGRGLYVRSAS